MPGEPSTETTTLAGLIDQSDAYAAEHNGDRPYITWEPYASASPADKQYLLDHDYCWQAA